MEISYNNYVDLDEQEIRQEEEKQIKEIQELLVNELDGIELDDNDDSNDESSGDFQEDDNNLLSKTLDDDSSRYEIESPKIDNNDKENNFYPYFNQMNNFVPNWTINSFPQFCNIPTSIGDIKNNFHYNYQQKNNNGLVDSSINWEISLYDEMGVSQSTHNNQLLSEKCVYSTSSNENSNVLPHHNTYQNCKKVNTRDVAIECIPSTQRELDNLELLYSARGNRIEQLQQELDLEREKRLKETRICNHKVILLESELKNESDSLKRSNQELEEQRQIILENKNVLSQQNENIIQLESTIEEFKEKVYSNNMIIESLNEQIAELTSNSVITRSNQKNSDLLDCINRQFDTDSQRLRAEIHRLSERVDEKIIETKKLEKLLDEEAENHRIERQEWKQEYDKIREDLENEKKYCKELENSQSKEKFDQLNNQINGLNLEKSLNDDVTNYLQDHVQDLSHQLLVYEKSMNLLDISNNGFNLDESYCEINVKPNFRSSCPLLSKTASEMGDKERTPITDHNNQFELQKQVFLLTKRTHSLTNRLLDVRKINLDSKSNVKKLQKIIEDYRQSKQNLQNKIMEMEKRLKEIQSGEETSIEKQLKISIESLEAINNSLEHQCKNLQNQLRQATDSMVEVDRNYKQLEEEFEAYKNLAHEDKETSIENIKQVCNNHYDNLRQQLEQSWMIEKDVLIEEAKAQRDKILRDLSDAINEVDRVKNLYIQLSQQKSNEESERTNWNEWLKKKLEDQNRSLNNQFKRDQDMMIEEIKIQHRKELEKLNSELNRCVSQEHKAVSTDHLEELSLSDSISIETSEKCIQVDNFIDNPDFIDELRSSHQKLETVIKDLEEENVKVRKEYDILNDRKLSVENENLLLLSKINLLKLSSKDPEISNSTKVIHQNDEVHNHIPNIIRSTTPQLILESKRINNSQSNTRTSTSKIHQQFKLLKEDLIKQLSKIPYSIPLVDYSCENNSFLHQSQSIRLSSIESSSDREIEDIKQKMYNFVLEIQARAASTLQLELQKSQIVVRKSLLEKLRHVIPILLSVDGQLIDIPSSKIKILSDKFILMLNHLQTNFSDENHFLKSNFGSFGHAFSSTSTPRNHKFPSNIHPNLSSIIKVDHIYNDSCDSTIKPNKENLIQEKCVKLKDEISQLSEALNKTSSQNVSSSQTNCPFENVDKWIYI